MKLGGIVYIGTHVWFELDNYSYLIIHILIKNLWGSCGDHKAWKPVQLGRLIYHGETVKMKLYKYSPEQGWPLSWPLTFILQMYTSYVH